MREYFNDLCSTWNYTSTAPQSTGYESVYPDLMKLSKESWMQATDTGKLDMEQAVFDIYRKINILPITYYSLEGCKDQILSLRGRSPKVSDGVIPVGNTAGLALSRFWFPNMQEATVLDNDTISLRSRFDHDAKFRRAIRLCYKYRDEGEKTVLPINIRRALELVNGGTIQNFKPLNAMAIWEYICPTMFGRVLDFSSGYGGRMLGAMTSGMRYHYTGIDPNTKTHRGLNALGQLVQDVVGTSFDMHCVGSEHFEPSEINSYDAAFSSPPYFNLEIYSDEETQCMNRYRDQVAWFDRYVAPTLAMIHRSLTSGALYAVNISDYKVAKQQYNIVDTWLQLSVKMGFEFVEKVDMMLNVRPGVGNGKLLKAFKSEGVYIFKKKLCLSGHS